MRLGQLARKVNVKPAQIVSFLKKEHNITVDDNLNSKIEDDSLALVLENFKLENKNASTKVKEAIVTETREEEVIETIAPMIEAVSKEEIVVELVEFDEKEKLKEAVTTENISTVPTPIVEPRAEEKLIAIDEDGEEIELNVVDGIIKAPKKELDGFKVVGKIDLPTKAKAVTFLVSKGSDSVDVTEDIETKRQELAARKKEEYLERKKKRQNKASQRKKGGRKVLTEIELKDKANKLAVEKQIQNSKVNKELKKKHYQENIQAKSASHKKKKKKKITKENDVKSVKGYDKKPTTTLGKIWKWFNT